MRISDWSSDVCSSDLIVRQVRTPTLAALARCHPDDIEACARALDGAHRPRIHVFISTSPLHREHKLGMDKAQVLARSVAAVELARTHVDDVEFPAADALRPDPHRKTLGEGKSGAVRG